MEIHPNVLRITFETHIHHTHSHHLSTRTQTTTDDKTTHRNNMGKKNETLLATYKAVMRQDLEYASSTWSPLAFSSSINKLQVMQNTTLWNVTGYTQDTTLKHLHDKNSHFPYTNIYSYTPHNSIIKHHTHRISSCFFVCSCSI